MRHDHIHVPCCEIVLTEQEVVGDDGKHTRTAGYMYVVVPEYAQNNCEKYTVKSL